MSNRVKRRGSRIEVPKPPKPAVSGAGNDGVAIITIHPGDVSGAFHQSILTMMLYDAGNAGYITCHGGHITARSGPRLPSARNLTVSTFLGLEPHADWALFIDADMIVPKDTPYRLMGTAKAHGFDMVGGLCFVGGDDIDEMYPTIYMLSENEHKQGLLGQDSVQRYPMGGIIQCDATGAACLLVHRRVLEKMEAVFKEHPYPWFAEGIHGGIEFGEDVTFCIRARQLGFKLAVDTRVEVGHEKRRILNQDKYRAYLQNTLGQDDLPTAEDHVPDEGLFNVSGPIEEMTAHG